MEEYHIVAKYAPDLLKQYVWDEDTELALQEYETRLVKETDPLGILRTNYFQCLALPRLFYLVYYNHEGDKSRWSSCKSSCTWLWFVHSHHSTGTFIVIYHACIFPNTILFYTALSAREDRHRPEMMSSMSEKA